MTDRIDLSSLDPTRDTARFEAMAHSIARAAIAERRRTRSVFVPVIAWTRATLATAAVVLIVAGSTLALVHPPTSSTPPATEPAPSSLVESAGIPRSLVAVAMNARPLTTAELVAAFDTMASSGTLR
jgi:hypothetical protein